MPIHTYGSFSEEIITEYYKKIRNDSANYTLRHIAEQVAQEVAFFAKADAYEMDRLGESVFSNDQFICTYFGLDLLTNTNGVKYVPLPNIPAGLPQGRELAEVVITGNTKSQVIPMRNKDRFMQQFTFTPAWMILAYINGENILFDNISPLVTGPVDIKLIGAIPTGSNLLDLPLTIPKSTQSQIFDKILNRMNMIRNVLPDQVNDNISK